MPRALSVDLRLRIVNACQAGQMSQKAIAERFQVGHSTVEKVWRQWRTRGTLAAKPPAGGPRARLADAQDTLRQWVQEDPDARLDDLVRRVREQLGIATSIQALSRTLIRLGLRRKKDRRGQRAGTTRRGGGPHTVPAGDGCRRSNGLGVLGRKRRHH